MAYKLIVTDLAEANIEQSIAHIVNELCNPTAAGNLFDEIEKRYALLEQNPHVYPECRQTLLKVRQYRKVVIGGYLLVFRIDEGAQAVYIERFFNGLEDYANKL